METEGTLKSAAFFDVDGTLTTENVWSGLLGYFKQRKLRNGTRLAFLTYHYSRYMLKEIGLLSELAFRTAWALDLARFFRGTSLSQAEEIWESVINDSIVPILREDTCALLQEHLRDGDVVVLVSGGPQPLVQRIARHLGTEHGVGTPFARSNGVYTGRSPGPPCQGVHKMALAQQYLLSAGIDIDLQSSHAYADSEVDVPMLEQVGFPVAVYPDEALSTIAQERGWRVFPG